MIKVIGLFKRKPGLTPREFRDYYEEVHAPLARRTAPMGDDYRRNYPQLSRVEGKEIPGDAAYDAVSEVWFQDQAAYDAFAQAMLDPQVRETLVADEARFMDRTQSIIMIVEECRSPAA
jgi:uncharacterized protein (TIGR02118 family)